MLNLKNVALLSKIIRASFNRMDWNLRSQPWLAWLGLLNCDSWALFVQLPGLSFRPCCWCGIVYVCSCGRQMHREMTTNRPTPVTTSCQRRSADRLSFDGYQTFTLRRLLKFLAFVIRTSLLSLSWACSVIRSGSMSLSGTVLRI